MVTTLESGHRSLRLGIQRSAFAWAINILALFDSRQIFDLIGNLTVNNLAVRDSLGNHTHWCVHTPTAS